MRSLVAHLNLGRILGTLAVVAFLALGTLIQVGAADDAAADRANRLPWAIVESPEQVDRLIQGGENVNATDEDGRTALHFAALRNETNKVKILLDNGANPNIIEHSSEGGFSGWGWYPLHLALRNENKEIVLMLIAHGADCNARRTDGWFPLHTAAYHGQPDVIDLLIAHGADVNVKNGGGETPLRLTIDLKLFPAAKVLLNHGSDPNSARVDSTTLLHAAAGQSSPMATSLLLAYKANPNVKNKLLDTPLHIAAASGNTAVVKLLLASGAKTGAVNARGETPLHKAAYMGYGDIASLLIAKGASVSALTKAHETPLKLAKAGQKSYHAGDSGDFQTGGECKRSWDAVKAALLRSKAK